VNLANWQTVPIVKAAVSKVDVAGGTSEAVIMPGGSERLDVLISCFNSEVTSTAKGCEQGIVMVHAIRLFVLPVKNAVLEGAAAFDAYKTSHMPSLIQRMHNIPDYLFAAFGTCVGEVALEAGTAEDFAFVLDEARSLERCIAARRLALKALRVPILTDGLAVFTANRLTTHTTDRTFAGIAALALFPGNTL